MSMGYAIFHTIIFRAKNDFPKQFYVDSSDPLYSLPNTFVKVVEKPTIETSPDYENIQESIVNECFAKAISLLISPVSMLILGPSPKHTTSIIASIEDISLEASSKSWVKVLDIFFKNKLLIKLLM